jgi:hypothetical protein
MGRQLIAFNAAHSLHSNAASAARREFDVIMAWSVDRLGRSLQDLVGFLSEIHASGVDLFLTSAGHRHHHAGRQGDVSDAGRVR